MTFHESAGSSSSPPVAQLCFILGIAQRSGTNYLSRLIRKHPRCLNPGPIWEDFFVRHSDCLKQYVDRVYGSWNDDWKVDEVLGPRGMLMDYLGDGVGRLLRRQLEVAAEKAKSKVAGEGGGAGQMLVTKTPSVTGIENFAALFPEAYLIVIVRDGRAVVESGVRSFDWSYEDATRRWRDSGRKIVDVQGRSQERGRMLIVRYEDLVRDEEGEIRRILGHLGLDAEEYDFEAAKSMGVAGSSEVRKEKDSVDWRERKKSDDFDPLARFRDWDAKRHERFNWIAGDVLDQLGYEPMHAGSPGAGASVRNRIKDGIWWAKRGYRVIKELVREFPSRCGDL